MKQTEFKTIRVRACRDCGKRPYRRNRYFGGPSPMMIFSDLCAHAGRCYQCEENLERARFLLLRTLTHRRIQIARTTFWFVIERSTELVNTWSAHCLDLDVVTFGDSFEHAREMVLEASRMILDADAKVGRNSLSRRAPEEFWSKLIDQQLETKIIYMEVPEAPT